MIDEIYQKDLLRHAAAAVGHGRLEAPGASVTVDNPLCGDRVTLDVSTLEGRVVQLSHVVRACLLCQASASIIGARAEGETLARIAAIMEAVRCMLQEDVPLPGDIWSDLSAFTPVAAHRSRHNCVLLPFEALIQAGAQSES